MTATTEIRPVRPDEYDALGRLTLDAHRTVGPQSPGYEAELAGVALPGFRLPL